MRASEIFSSNYLSAEDLSGPMELTIEQVTMEEVGRNKESKLVIQFKGAKKGMVLNKTNYKQNF